METLIILMSFLSTVSLFADWVGLITRMKNVVKKRVFICRFVTLALFIFLMNIEGYFLFCFFEDCFSRGCVGGLAVSRAKNVPGSIPATTNFISQNLPLKD